MSRDRLLEGGNAGAIWQKYCGFFNLSPDEFMDIQRRLLLDEIDQVYGSTLARKFMLRKPRDISEFRATVPLTRYEDYAEYLDQKREDVLAFKPYVWTHTSGRGGSLKWVPCSAESYERLGYAGITVLLIACAHNKGEVNIRPGVRFLQNLPPKPYYAWLSGTALADRMEIFSMPPIEWSANDTFESRMKQGFNMALRYGVDVLGSLTSVLVKMGESFAEGSRKMSFSRDMLHPAVISRVLRAMIRSKISKRHILPHDLWPVKGLICYGMDTSIYKEQIVHYWGVEPMEMYAATEVGMMAIQAWNRKGLTFSPYAAFLEFIPEEEWLKSRDNPSYQPSTVLFNEVQAGKRYELVITNFYGMPFLRYRIGDLVRVEALEDAEAGIKLPQIVFSSRADDLIDIGGFTRLDEKTVWQAIYNSKVPHADWCVRKEYQGEQPVLNVYIELIGSPDLKEVEQAIDREMVSLNHDYENLHSMLNIYPLRVTALSQGSFQRYFEAKRRAGASPAHLKPRHMNPDEAAIKELMMPASQEELAGTIK